MDSWALGKSPVGDGITKRPGKCSRQKASLVMTNMPAQNTTLPWAGSRMIQPMFWVPQSGNVGISSEYIELPRYGAVWVWSMMAPDSRPDMLITFLVNP